jgi:hypothetical protein
LNGSLFAHMRRSAVLVTKKEPDTASFKTPDLRNVLMTARIPRRLASNVVDAVALVVMIRHIWQRHLSLVLQ